VTKEEMVGYTDAGGYVRCLGCQEGSWVCPDFAIWSDNSAFYGECCDFCGKTLQNSQSVNQTTLQKDGSVNRITPKPGTCES
jgi:hypothetical protein